ncbi:PaaI family thioesterase [Tropicimonas marinistellae]|uniref:PaaI family thioesterase n=1 Tax=Tropicimonas marinistellae TaxID=1739787 RepID=UPI00082FD5AD|nr:PaaI family thioesterase [Tropicimonas marinistellae]
MEGAQRAEPGWRNLQIAGFMDQIGPLQRSTREGEADRYGLATNDSHANHIGSIHGGVIASLLDQVIALTAWQAADRQPTVTVQMDTRFLGAAKAGDFLESRARLRHATRTLLFVDGEVTRGDAPIATATAVMKITPMRKGTE